MTTRTLGAGGVALWALIVVAASAPDASGFSPFGGSSFFELELRFARWAFEDLDRNGDEDVSGPDDGIEYTLEGGELGWTRAEMEIIEESFQVWEDVPSSFVAFSFTTPIEDPLEVFGNLGDESFLAVDGIRFVAANVPGDLFFDGSVTGGVLGIAYIDVLIDDGFFEFPNAEIGFFVEGGGRIYECDIVINAAAHRSPGGGLPASADLKGTLVHEIGHSLGIGHTPMNNLDLILDDDGEIIGALENPVVGMRDAQGRLALHGVTPTMFPTVFAVQDEDSQIRDDGGADLSWDDIAAVTFLYPRANQGNFFAMDSHARSQASNGFPSVPILGGLVTAWVDTDRSPNTPRVPLTSTLTGLYTFVVDIYERGDFYMPNLPKEIEHPAISGPFNPTYTFTIESVRGDKIPGRAVGEDYDTTHLLRPEDQWETVEYSFIFPSQTYLEEGELFGSNNHDSGTPFVFDQQQGLFVSTTSGRTLDQLLRRGTPMFGDADQLCALDIIEQAVLLPVLPNMLRGLRDGVLLNSAVGALAVDAYYQAAPSMARALSSSPVLKGAAVRAAVAAEWALTRDWFIVVVLAAAVLIIVRRTRRGRAVAVGIVAFAALMVVTGESSARVLYMNDKQLTAQSDAIIQGRVIATEPRLRAGDSGVATDTTIVADVIIDGDENKGSSFYLTVPGGRVGNLQSNVSELAHFEEGEEVILYLTFVEDFGYVVTGGYQGKVTVTTNKDTGGPEVEGRRMVRNKTGEMQSEGMVPLEEYKDRIRGYVEKKKNGELDQP